MEPEAILNGAFIIGTAVRFSKIVQALDMETKSNMLEFVEAAYSADAQVSLESAVLRRYTTLSYWVWENNVPESLGWSATFHKSHAVDQQDPYPP